jgi:hypothetical protein
LNKEISMLEDIAIYPKPEHIPLTYWRSKEYESASVTMTEYIKNVIAKDARTNELAILESQCDVSPLRPHLDEYHLLDEFCASLDSEDYEIAEELGTADDGVMGETKALQYVTSVTELANEYVPKLAGWTRESVPELPADLTPIALEELACHVFAEALYETLNA